MAPLSETFGLIVLVVLPMLAIGAGYSTCRTARRANASNPIRRGVGTAVVLLLTVPVTFGTISLYATSESSFRVLYFLPVVLLVVALYAFSPSKRTPADEAK